MAEMDLRREIVRSWGMATLLLGGWIMQQEDHPRRRIEVLGLLVVAFCACGATVESSGGPMSGSGGAVASMPTTETGSSTLATGGGGGQAGAGSQAGAGGAAAEVADGGGDVNVVHAADGNAREPDGAMGPPDAADVGASDAGGASYVCSLILGIQTTHEWFGGFEKVVDTTRWELKSQDSAHIEKWADPNNAVWALATESPCVRNADAPDRVVFMGVNYDFTTVEQFLPKYIAVVSNIRAKYPTVKRVDVMTYTRAPGDMECTSASRPNDSYIKPAQDESIAMLAAMYPGFVFPAPKWEVQSCADFTLCPHLTGTANDVISKAIGAYFLVH